MISLFTASIGTRKKIWSSSSSASASSSSSSSSLLLSRCPNTKNSFGCEATPTTINNNFKKIQWCLTIALVCTVVCNVWVIKLLDKQLYHQLYKYRGGNNNVDIDDNDESYNDLIRWLGDTTHNHHPRDPKDKEEADVIKSHAYIPKYLLLSSSTEEENNYAFHSNNDNDYYRNNKSTTIVSIQPSVSSFGLSNNYEKKSNRNHKKNARLQLQQQQNVLLSEPFEISPSCQQNMDHINKYCKSWMEQSNVCKKQTYDVHMEHLQLQLQSQSQFQKSQPVISTITSSNSNSNTKPKCKTLWFSGFSEGTNSKCKNSTAPSWNGTTTTSTSTVGGIRMDYAVALASARVMATETIQPVLLLGRYGMKDNDNNDNSNNNNNNTNESTLQKWAMKNGAIVITVNELSFQKDIIAWYKNSNPPLPNDYLIGPYLRIDIPTIIRRHNLFTIIPNICPRHVLYTDNDVLFTNPISYSDLDVLKKQISPSATTASTPFIMYGREHKMNHRHVHWYHTIVDKFYYYFLSLLLMTVGKEQTTLLLLLLHHQTKAYPINTGVMLLDVYRFEENIIKMIQFRNEYKYPQNIKAFDQDWLNLYFTQSYKTRHERVLLPIYWNWKLYWPMHKDDTITNIKIIHYHGPKPISGAWNIAQCSESSIIPPNDRILQQTPDIIQQQQQHEQRDQGADAVTTTTNTTSSKNSITTDGIAKKVKSTNPYTYFITMGICCDYGKSAYRVQTFYQALRPNEMDVCY